MRTDSNGLLRLCLIRNDSVGCASSIIVSAHVGRMRLGYPCAFSRAGARRRHTGSFRSAITPAHRTSLACRPGVHHNASVAMGNSTGALMNSRPVGFTLVELMITLVLIAILATIAAPSVRDVIRNARMTSAANDYLTDLSIARAEAVKRGVPTALRSEARRVGEA